MRGGHPSSVLRKTRNSAERAPMPAYPAAWEPPLLTFACTLTWSFVVQNGRSFLIRFRYMQARIDEADDVLAVANMSALARGDTFHLAFAGGRAGFGVDPQTHDESDEVTHGCYPRLSDGWPNGSSEITNRL